MTLLSGCYSDSFLDAMKEETDFIAPFDVVLNNNDTTRTVYFNISDTGNITSLRTGDDASFANTPAARSFTERLNINSTTGDVVDDNVTALTWTKCTSDNFKSMKTDDNCSGSNVEQTWNDAYTTCDTLTYAGSSDWRLPTISELFSLLFIVSVSVVYSEKSFRVLSRGSVRDNSTNLIWTRCPLSEGDKPIYDFHCKGEKKLYTWNEAVDACRNLFHEGRAGWRLPSVKEMQTIVFYYHYVTGDQNSSQVVEQVFPASISPGDIQSDYSAFWQSYCVSNTCHLHYWTSTSLNATTAFALNLTAAVFSWIQWLNINLSAVFPDPDLI